MFGWLYTLPFRTGAGSVIHDEGNEGSSELLHYSCAPEGVTYAHSRVDACKVTPEQVSAEYDKERNSIRQLLLGSYSELVVKEEVSSELLRRITGWDNAVGVLFDLNIDELGALGVRVRGRYWIESALSPHATQMGADIATAIESRGLSCGKHVVFDLFAGTGNLAYHISTAISALNTVCFDNNALAVADMEHNFRLLGLKMDVVNAAFPASLDTCQRVLGTFPASTLAVFVVDPPWGEAAFQYGKGLDLRKTNPDIGTVVRSLKSRFRDNNFAIVLKTHVQLAEESLWEVSGGLDLVVCSSADRRAEGVGPAVALLVPTVES